MKAIAVGFMIAVVSLSGCAWLQKNAKSIDAVLNAGELTCIETSKLTNSVELAAACGIAEELVPVIEQLIAQREAAGRVGVHWQPAHADAGAH